ENQLVLTKKFSLPKFEDLKGADRLREEYQLWLDVSFANEGQQPITIPNYWLHTGSAAPLHANDSPLFIGFNYLRGTGNKFVNMDWFAEGGFLFFKHAARPAYPEQPERVQDVRWAAVANQYFSTMIVPQVDL